jgi:transcriptional regulator
MYIPASFAETDIAKLHAQIERHSFATLVSHGDGEMQASHLPLLLERAHGPQGRLIGHLARANPQWRTADGQTVLAIFHGPHAYISPTWHESQDVVPTWNYVAVHAYGVFRIIGDGAALRDVIERTVQLYEAGRPAPWRTDSQDPAFIDKLLGAIVGFTIDIDRLEGKWKLGQNHSVERREKVIARLEAAGGEDAQQIAALMRETLTPSQS